jgi:hypothetical protein
LPGRYTITFSKPGFGSTSQRAAFRTNLGKALRLDTNKPNPGKSRAVSPDAAEDTLAIYKGASKSHAPRKIGIYGASRGRHAHSGGHDISLQTAGDANRHSHISCLG